MKFSEAIKTQDINGLTEVVDRAVAIYGATQPEEPEVETVYGPTLFSAVIDDESRWQLAALAYVEVITEAKHIPEGCDKKVEVAKLIATHPVLRAMTGTSLNEVDELI